MADNVTVVAGAYTATVASDDVGGVQYQRVKIAMGAADAYDADVDSGQQTMANSLPVAIASNQSAISVSDGASSLTVDNGGTFAVQVDGASLTALQLIDDMIYTDDTSTHSTGTSKGALIMAAAAPTDTAVNANDIGAVGMTVNRELYVSLITALPAGSAAIGKLAANNGVDIGDVDVTSIVPGTSATSLGKAVDSAGGATDTGIAILALRDDVLATLTPVDGDYANLRVNNKGALHVTGEDLDVAHDATDSGNPVKVGFKAETSPKGITLVSDGDRTDGYADSDGIQMVKLNTSFADLVSEAVSNTDGSSTAFTNFSAVASTKNYVTDIVVYRTDSGSSLAYVDFRDGTAGSVLWRMPLPPNGGSSITSTKPLFKTSASTALAYDVSSALTTVYISVSGFQSKAG